MATPDKNSKSEKNASRAKAQRASGKKNNYAF
jgi:hypothetical protein